MGICTPQEHALFLHQVPGFEQSLVSNGILVFKVWFTVSQARQKLCFNEQRRARLGAIRSVLHSLDYEHKDQGVVGEADPRVVRTAQSVFIDN